RYMNSPIALVYMNLDSGRVPVCNIKYPLYADPNSRGTYIEVFDAGTDIAVRSMVPIQAIDYFLTVARFQQIHAKYSINGKCNCYDCYHSRMIEREYVNKFGTSKGIVRKLIARTEREYRDP